MYQVGQLENIRDDDPKFDSYDEALKQADKLANNAEAWDSEAYAVWDEETGECLAIVFQTQVYTP